jgi:hypothetical protein
MRIQDILNEGPFDAIAKVASAAKSAVGDAQQGYKAGYKAVDKALSPRKWAGGTSDDASDTSIEPHVIKTVLKKAVAGEKLYIADIAALKAARAKVESGEIPFKGNKNNLLLALRSVYNSKPIDDNQKALISQLSTAI